MDAMSAHVQWANRPDDERFTSLPDMLRECEVVSERSRFGVVSSRKLEVLPWGDDHRGLAVVGPNGGAYAPTHWAFGQLCALAGTAENAAPAAYLRGLPSELAADCLNYGLHHVRSAEDLGVLIYSDDKEERTVRAMTGPNYGRIRDDDVLRELIRHVGDGVTGNWRVPGIFGERVTVTKENTTLYRGDRDFFVFLADEDNRVSVPNRRDGKSGEMARGFYLFNSEVGARRYGIAAFYFDYVCANRIVWGMTGLSEFVIRHTKSAPDRWLEELKPALEDYTRNRQALDITAIVEAQKAKIRTNVDEFLAKRFGKRMAGQLNTIHQREEHRPIETLWDATVAVTAVARGISNQAERVALESKGGDLLTMAIA